MTPADPGPGCYAPDRVAWPRPYVSLSLPVSFLGLPAGQGDFTTHYELTRAPIVRAAVWMFYRNQEKAA